MSQSQDFVYDPPTTQGHQHKIFIYDANTHIGHRLVQYFRNDHIIEVNPNVIMGTIDSHQQTANDIGLNYQIDVKNQRLLNASLVSSEIIVFPLNNRNTQQLEHLLKFLKCLKSTQQKKVVVISSIFEWKLRNNNNFFKRQQFLQRIPIKSIYSELENLALGIHHYNPMVKGSVVNAGLVYGMGQDVLFQSFKQALQQKQNLKVFGLGNNKIPMIHVDDLSQLIFDIAFSKQSGFYYGVDQGETSQKELITQISRTLGNGKVQQVTIEHNFLSEHFDIFNANIIVDPKSYPQINSWKSRNGFVTNIGKIVGQFNTSRGLKPNKILIYGTPASGKSKLAEILKSNYGLPVINIKGLIQEIKEEDSKFANEIKASLQELRAIKIEQERKVNEQAKKKKKGKGVEQFDPSKVVVKLGDEDILKIVKRRINMSDCLNKGYIIDSVLKSYQHLEAVLLGQNGSINEAVFPNSVFLIEGSEQQTKDRVKKLPPTVTQGTHLTQEQTVRRFGVFNKLNQSKKWHSFFTDKIQIKNVPLTYSDPSEFISYIERNGPLGFKAKPQKQEIVEKPEEQSNKHVETARQEEQASEEEDTYEEFNLQKLTQNETKILNQKSRPIRQYLIDNVIPQITQGLLQVCKEVPPDPIKFLINFLQTKNSRKKKSSNKM